MTEFSHEQDELASAYLDDDVTIEERAHVEGDPALLARVEELRSVRDALAVPVVSPSAAVRDAAINAALSASNVVALDVARGQRRVRMASIAAAILLVLGAAGLLIRAAGNQSTDKFQTVAGALSTASAGPTAERAATEAGGATADRSSFGRAALGSFADRSSLAAAAQSQVHNPAFDQSKQAAPSTFATTAGDDGAAGGPNPLVCPVSSPPDAVNEIYAATAVLQGRTVQVDVFTITDGSLMLVVTDAASCTQVFTQPV